MKKGMRSSFSTILLIIVSVSILPSLMIIIWTGLEHVRYIEAEEIDDALRRIESLSQVQDTITSSVKEVLSILVSLPAFQEDEESGQVELLRKVLWRNPDLKNIVRTDDSGVIQYAAWEDETSVNSSSLHIRRALDGGGFVAGSYLPGDEYGELVFPFAATIRNRKGDVVGALAAEYSFSIYYDYFESLNLDEQAILTISDEEGIRIFRTPLEDLELIGTPMKAEIWTSITEGADTGIVTGNDEDGLVRLYVYRKLRISKLEPPYLCVILSIPKKIVQKPARASLSRNILLVMASAGMSLLLAALIGNRILGKKVKKLSSTVTKIEYGHLSARTGIENAPVEIMQVASEIDKMASTLQERNRERDQSEQRLSEALAEKQTLLLEVHHRVKNNMQLILSLINLEKENYSDIELYSAKLESRIQAMSSVHELLYQSDSYSSIDIHMFIDKLATLNKSIYPHLEIEIQSEDSSIKLDNAISLALIINELLTNSAKYGCSEDGIARILLNFTVQSDQAVLTIKDEGQGFPEGLHIEKLSSFGLIVVDLLAKQIGGKLTIENDHGGKVSVMYPLDNILRSLKKNE